MIRKSVQRFSEKIMLTPHKWDVWRRMRTLIRLSSCQTRQRAPGHALLVIHREPSPDPRHEAAIAFTPPAIILIPLKEFFYSSRVIVRYAVAVAPLSGAHGKRLPASLRRGR
jgi:hypothetical protein